jgi:hypothetical protein
MEQRQLQVNSGGVVAQSQRSPKLAFRFGRLASTVVGSNYDISDRCNLRCEGCLYFEGADRANLAAPATDAAWDGLFAQERARGVNFAYLAGAEPALAPARLRSAARHIGRGVVFTNGTVPIDPALPFRLHVWLWGGPDDTQALRGGDCFARAFRLFAGDKRARFVFTVNALNIGSAWIAAERCAAAGVKLSFSLFSPTEQYRARLQAADANDNAYFRISAPERQLTPSPADLARIRSELDSIAARYPETVVYCRAYSRWVTDPAGLYAIDPATGWATDCGTRRTAWHRHVRADLSTSDSKCCSPNIECRTCRAYSMATGTAVSRFRGFASTFEGFRDWLDISEQWAALFLQDWPDDA